jgi:putative RecB family exonuclease
VSDQLEMPGMPRRLFSATPSKLATFADCPRRYRFAYLTRPTPPKGPAWAHNTVGSAVHAALRSWWELPLGRRTPGAARQLLYGVWSRAGFRDEEQADRWRARAAGWLTDYVTGLDPDDQPVGTERTVGATTERLALSGRIDRIDARGEELVVVDYKTGRTPCTEEEARGSPALAIYVLGVRRTLRRACSRVELHHLPSGTVAAFEHTERSLANHVRRAEDIVADIETATEAVAAGQDADAAFPPVTGQQCSWCDFRPSCPAGQAAVPPREPWSFLADAHPSPAPRTARETASDTMTTAITASSTRQADGRANTGRSSRAP